MKKIAWVGIALLGMVALSGSVWAGFTLKAKTSVRGVTPQKYMSVTGVVKSVKKKTLSITTAAGNMRLKKKKTRVVVLKMNKLTQIKGTGKKDPSIEDLLPGKPVRVEYTEKKGKKTKISMKGRLNLPGQMTEEDMLKERLASARAKARRFEQWAKENTISIKNIDSQVDLLDEKTDQLEDELSLIKKNKRRRR